MSNIPVTLLTGFLGSGKSTLLTQILRDPRFSDTAVVVNEFGEIGLDGFLVEHSGDQIMEMTSGCLCCTIRGDIRQTLLDLHARRERGQIPMFERLVIETTGLADPAPVIHTLMADPRLDRRYMLGGIVTTIDAVNGEHTLDTQIECVKQAAVADRIVLTKTDLALDPMSQHDIEKLRGRLHAINPGAAILDKNADGFNLRRLFDTSLYDPATKTMDVQKWLNEEAYQDAHGHGHHHAHHDHAHHHDITRHGDNIRAFTVTLDTPLDLMAFTDALELLIASHGETLLRVKGIVHAAGRPEQPLVIHGVQHVFHDPVWLDAWPDADRRTRIVFITAGLGEETVRALLAADGLTSTS